MSVSKAEEAEMKRASELLSQNTKAILSQYAASAAATISVIMSGNSLGWPSPAMPRLLAPDSPVPMNMDDSSWMISLMYLGNLVSPIPCGILMEKIGRKMTLLYLNLFPLLSWLIIILTRSTYWLYLARFLAGLWLGIVYTVVPIYLGEIAEPRIRGSLSTLFSITTYVGVLYEYVLGPYVSYDALALASGSFCIVFIFAFGWVPETPYYLTKIITYSVSERVVGSAMLENINDFIHHSMHIFFPPDRFRTFVHLQGRQIR